MSNAQYLQVGPDNRYLQKDSGESFFWLGDTAWELIHQLNREEIDFYLKDRNEKGFNVIQTVIVSPEDGLQSPNAYGELPFVDHDPTKINEKFFKHVDYVLERAASLGIYVSLEPTWAIHVIELERFDNLHVFTPQNAFIYGNYLGERYSKYWNVVWMLGGDTNPTKEGRIDIWEKMAEGIRAGSEKYNLITYHPMGFSSSSDYIHGKEWLDFIGLQVGHKRKNNLDAQFVKQAWDKEPTKPVLNLESTYEEIAVGFRDGNGVFDDYDVRKSAYWSVFSGSLGYTYGHHAVWQMHDATTAAAFSELDIPWQEALDAPGAKQMSYLKELITARPAENRKPSEFLLLQADSVEPRLGAQSDLLVALSDRPTNSSNNATYILVYSPTIKRIKVNTSVIDDEELIISWFNPRNGTVVDSIEQSNKETLTIEPPSDNGPDWVLIIDSKSKGYKMP